MLASVVIPTKGRPDALRRALASLAAQDESDWEAIVVDDGDGEGIEAALALGDARILAVPNAGRGQVDARMTAIERARGGLLCWLDDDDWWHDRRHLTLLADAARAHENAFFFRGGWIVHEPEGRHEVFDHDATSGSLRRNNTILTSSLAYRRSVHDEIGPLDASVGSYGDWDFILRMCGHGLAPRKLSGLSVCYAVHGGNVSTAVDEPARLAGFRAFVAKHGLDTEIHSHVTMHRMLTDWNEVDGKLERTFEFPTFPDAIAFVGRIAELAERENHHPDIEVHYKEVVLRWWTHSAGGVTDRDRELAEASAALV